jgi:CspA family cold shock protein
MFLTGRVKWFDKKKGYGFVESPKGDIFIHYTFFKEEDLVLNNNDLISFNAIDGEKGLKAQNITKVG